VDPELRRIAEAAKGFMPPDEGIALHEAARHADGPFVEIGTYCGKSAVYLGAAARETGTVLFTIDHHHGSEEMQAGWQHHDESTVDESGRIDSFPFFRRTMREAGLDDAVVAIVGDSLTIARHWRTPIGFCFIDGAHSPEPAMADYEAWTRHLRGVLAIHDVFDDPAEGGQGPFFVYERALRDGFEEIGACGSLRILKR
jgi:predicted O-methyltransferase YrrM